MILHRITESSNNTRLKAYFADRLSESDAVLFMESGVYNLMSSELISELLAVSPSSLLWYSLQPDLQARGLEVAALEPLKQNLMDLTLVDYPGFVTLTERYTTIVRL